MGNITGKGTYVDLTLRFPNLTIEIYTVPLDSNMAYCILNFKFLV
jgi:hypothetical protein